MWPKCAFGDQKGLIWNKDLPFGNFPYHRTKIADFQKIDFLIYFTFDGPKSGILGPKTVFSGVLDRVRGIRPETNTEINRNGPQKQDPIVSITHR